MVRNVIGLYRRAYVGLPREVWMLSAALFVNRCGTMVVPFFALYLTSSLGYSEASAGRMLSIYGLGSIAGVYASGRLIGRVGAIRLQICLFLLSVPAFLVIPWCTTWELLAVSAFCLSFFTDGVRPANATAVARLTPRHLQVRAFGLQRMALNLGVSFGPAIGGLLATISFVWLFVADAATTLLCAVMLIRFFGFRRYTKTTPVAAQQEAEHGGIASPWTDRPYVAFVLLNLCVAIVFFQVHVTYPLYLRDHFQLTKPTIGLIFAVNTVTIVLFEMLLLNAVRKAPLIPVVACGALFSCLGFGMLPFGQTVSYCVLSMLVITLGEMLWMPLALGWVAERSARGNQGAYMAGYTMVFSVAGVLSPAIGGAIYGFDHALVWYLSGSLGVALGLAFLVLHGWTRKEAALPATESGLELSVGE